MRTARILLLSIAFSLAAPGCKKDIAQPEADHSADSLSQNTYAVSRSPIASSAGEILTAPFDLGTNPSSLMIYDGDGHLKAEKQVPSGALDFKRWVRLGAVRYTWFEYDARLDNPAHGGFQHGHIVIADAGLHEIRRVGLLPYGGVTEVSSQGLDGHDFILLGDDHYIAMAYADRQVSNVPASLGSGGSAYVAAPVIQEVRNGQVIWQWEGSDFPEFYASSVERNAYTDLVNVQDYMHLNSMTIDEADGNLICSFRHTNQVVKIDRQTGAIVWRLGGRNSDFPLTEDMRFLRQHHATLTDGGKTLMLFDNGDFDERPYSRVLEFQLDEGSRTVSGFKSFTIPAPFSRFMGSVQKIGEHYLIGGGSAGYILEVNPKTGDKVLQMTSGKSSYRAYKY
jgi:arylsulfate sulfotransferase